MSDIIYKDESYAIQGAVFEVYREMGGGFLESVYQECLERELEDRNIPFVAQKELELRYEGSPLNQKYKPDIVCYDKIILGLKAAKTIAPEHKAQLINYLKATGLRLGLLVNFGAHPRARVQRIVV